MKIESISLSKFLSRYANVYGIDLKKVTHAEAQMLFPELKPTTFKELKQNMDEENKENYLNELFLSGKVILVNDGNREIPYYAPELTNEYEEDMEFDREEVPLFEINDEVYDYASLKEYELRNLLRRKFNSYRNQVCARKELSSRGIAITKKYRRKDFKDFKEEE